MLLGRPWQFDRFAIYDRKQNTYTIEKYGKTFTLTLLVEETKEQGKIIMIGRKELVSIEEDKSRGLAAISRHDIIETTYRRKVNKV